MMMHNSEDGTILVAVHFELADLCLRRGVSPQDLAGSAEHACVLCLCDVSNFWQSANLDMSSARDGQEYVHRLI
jgi:hypothetical protein